MIVLGVGGSIHDYAYCTVKDGRILCAVEEERISREKYGIGKKSLMARGKNYTLPVDDLGNKQKPDMIVTNSLMNSKFVETHFGTDCIKINHHMAHAASAYYPSQFDSCAILVSDARGSDIDADEFETISLYYAHNGQIDLLHRVTGREVKVSKPFFSKTLHIDEIYENSLGDFYSILTRICGFGRGEDGKLMGLAPYGTNKYRELLENCITYTDHGALSISYNNSFMESVQDLIENKQGEALFDVQKDLAYSAQEIFEDYTIKILQYLYQLTNCKNLCIAGGTGLNSVLNGKISDLTEFEHVYIQPAAGDAGTSIGAALYGYYNIANNKYEESSCIQSAYLGRNYLEEEISKSLHKYQDEIQWENYQDKSAMYYEAAKDIYNNKIVGWFQGGSEIGPRALGNRSILANACHKDMKDILNSRVKFRESFRPFAPSILNEYAKDYFKMNCDESLYMLKVFDVQPDKKDVIPSVVHVDGTARVQTVTKVSNSHYYNLISEFYKIAHVPVILNTSFNIKGEPIVETPEDAIKCFLSTNIDILYLDHFKVKKIN